MVYQYAAITLLYEGDVSLTRQLNEYLGKDSWDIIAAVDQGTSPGNPKERKVLVIARKKLV